MDMVQVAWAALGLLATALFGMFGLFFYLGAKIDSVNPRVDSLASILQAHVEHHAG